MFAFESVNALDPRSFDQLKRAARDGNSPEAIRAAARQFEALFLHMVLKSMRDASPKDGIFDSEQSRLYQSLLDQQLAMQLAARGGTGFGETIARQLGAPAVTAPAPVAGAPAIRFDALAAFASRQAANAAGELHRGGEILPPGTSRSANDDDAAPAVPDDARDFVDRVWPHALQAGRATGIPAHFLVAQAALETGWGRRELTRPDGSRSYNLFNIKAGTSWQGETVALDAVEYRDGKATREAARFRAYGSYDEAFRDYVRLLADNPRYAAVIGRQDAGGFARSLQQAGYATDPMYADKLERIISGQTLRVALSGN